MNEPCAKVFEALANAANRAQAAGEEREAITLDRLARTENARLSNVKMRKQFGNWFRHKPLNWRDVPSTLLREPKI